MVCSNRHQSPSSSHSSCTLAGVVQEAPHLVSCLCDSSCAALSACNKQLNQLLHQYRRNYATTVTIHNTSSLRTVAKIDWQMLVVIILPKQLWRKDNSDWPEECSVKLLATPSVVKDSCSHTLLIVLPNRQRSYTGASKELHDVLRDLGFKTAWNMLRSQEWKLLSQLIIRDTDGRVRSARRIRADLFMAVKTGTP